MRALVVFLGLASISCTPPVVGPDASIDLSDAHTQIDVFVPPFDSCSQSSCPIPKKCPDDMVLIIPEDPFTLTKPDGGNFDPRDFDFDPSSVNKPFCIDRYEWPNLQDFPPITGKSYSFAEQQCASVGKRLPLHSEWTVACEGMHKYVFGYSDTYDKSKCNLSKKWIAPNWGLMSNDSAWSKEVKRLYQADLSGTNAQCFSEWDNDKLWDMVGNAAEWTRDDNAQYGVAVMGCSWVNCLRPEPASCYYGNFNHEKGFKSYEFSFRCAADTR